MLGRASWLEVGGGVFIPLPEKEPLQPLSPKFPVGEAGDSGPKGRRLRTQKVRKKPMQKNSYRRLRTTKAGDSGRAETPGKLRTNSGRYAASAVRGALRSKTREAGDSGLRAGDSGQEKQQQNSKA